MVGEAAIVFISVFRVAFDNVRMIKRYGTTIQNFKFLTTIIICVTESNGNIAKIEIRMRT